jgi:trehalose 6-phosphate synthase
MVNILGATLHDDGRIEVDGLTTRTVANPVGIDAETFAGRAKAAVQEREAIRLRESLVGRYLVIGVDRLDYSKGLPNRFEGYGHFLQQHPEYRLKVSYLQIAAISRGEVQQYQALRRELDRVAGAVNGRFAEFDWIPIRYMTRAVPRTTLAGFYRLARVGLVTPLRDGMNLVAKEYVAAQDSSDPGVLILSRFAGAAESMREAVIINPYDPDAIAEAIAEALVMPLAERMRRHEALLGEVHRVTARSYCGDFLRQLAETPARHTAWRSAASA